MDSFTVAAGETVRVENSATITSNGDVTIDGTLFADTGRIFIKAAGALTINGTMLASDDSLESLPGDVPLRDIDSGIVIIIGDGEGLISDTAVLETNGYLIVTDDESVLDRTPSDFYNEVEDLSGDNLDTLAPLPPDNPAFSADEGTPKSIRPTTQQAMLPPFTAMGTWPPPGAAPVPGDVPVWIFRFNGPRILNLNNYTVNGPTAPAGGNVDQSMNPGDNATGNNGKKGMRLNIWNNGGPINIVNTVTLNLANGGDGGNATGACSKASGGDGGKSGNMRMTASAGINITGNLIINPGRGGNGGSATVTKGPAGADGCPGDTGESADAKGGKGADNKKRLRVRGNVSGVGNISIGPLVGGAGGAATADACDGGDGFACCAGGPGGPATAEGGRGGDATLEVSGLGVTVGAATGGVGGSADATGGNGGNGGDCKFADAGDGGAGGEAGAEGGVGGNASNPAGAANGGDGGDGTATGGDGGIGGDSGFGSPGDGGAAGEPDAAAGSGGTGNPTGNDGDAEANDGSQGAVGGQLPILIFCFPFDFLPALPGPFDPGPQTGPVFSEDGATELGTLTVNFGVDPLLEPNIQRGENPDHIGIGNGATIEIELVSLSLQSVEPITVGGLRIEPLQGFDVDAANPLRVEALDANGGVIDMQEFPTIPDNFANPSSPEVLDTTFDDSLTIDAFRIVSPPGSFVTIRRIYLLDP